MKRVALFALVTTVICGCCARGPEGGCSALLGRQGGTKPPSRTRMYMKRLIPSSVRHGKHCLKSAAVGVSGGRVRDPLSTSPAPAGLFILAS
jgi:hypothetical protein